MTEYVSLLLFHTLLQVCRCLPLRLARRVPRRLLGRQVMTAGLVLLLLASWRMCAAAFSYGVLGEGPTAD